MRTDASGNGSGAGLPAIDPTYRRTGRLRRGRHAHVSGLHAVRGGSIVPTFADYRQTNGSAFSFQRADAEVQRFVPVMNETGVIALRAAASTTFTGDGQVVPYFLLPALGGHDALRGYSSWRFRDRNRLLLSGEYRWTAGPLVDMSIFVDAGKVAPRIEELTLRDLRTSFGIGVSLHTPGTTLTRLEVARSREGVALLISFGPSF